MLVIHTHTHKHIHMLIYCKVVELGWQTETNSLWLYFGRKQKVCLCCFVSVSPLHTSVSPASLLSGFLTQSAVYLDFMSLIDCWEVHIVYCRLLFKKKKTLTVIQFPICHLDLKRKKEVLCRASVVFL